MRNKSHELQWFEAMYNRNGLTETELKNYQRLKRGLYGEEEFDWIYDFLIGDRFKSVDDRTYQLRNMVVQIDKMIQVENKLYIIDIKNYHGSYKYENNQWRVGSKLLAHNILEQLRRVVRLIQKIVEEAGLKYEVAGVITFFDPNSSVNLVEPIEEEVLSFSEMLGWLGKKHSQSLRSKQDSNLGDWQTLLKTFEIEGYRTQYQCNENKLAKLTKGIRCTECGSYDIKEYRSNCVCRCGNIEVKETSYVRTICEYGLIMHHKDIKLRDLVEFFGKGVNKHYVKKVLRDHFVTDCKPSKNSWYKNKGVDFKIWFKDQEEVFNKIEKRKHWKID